MRVEIVDAALKVPAIPETRPKRAERRKKWLDERRGGSAEAKRQPGSLRPFHRIQALTAPLVEANKVLVGLLAIRPGLLARLFGRTERTPEQVKALGDAQEAVVRRRDALTGYKSRGHGWKQ